MKINIVCVTRQLYENKDKTIKQFTPEQAPKNSFRLRILLYAALVLPQFKIFILLSHLFFFIFKYKADFSRFFCHLVQS